MTAYTQVSTTSVSLSRTRKRALSLSLLGKQSSAPLHDLPAEIIIHILELALLNDRPGDLALISQVIRHFINTIIYRTVVLDTPRTTTLFHRTASSRHSSHLLTHVKSLAVTEEPEYLSPNTEQQLRQIIAHCPSLRKVALPSSCQINISPSGLLPLHDGPSDLTIQSFDGFAGSDPFSSEDLPLLPTYFSTSLTHLRISEPGNTWRSPLSIIASLHDAPNLTHLQLSRRADSNEDNDIIFTEHVTHLLTTRKKLKMVVVSIFGGLMRASSEALRESNIWKMVSELETLDPRIVVLEGGELGDWREEWKDVRGFRCGGYPSNFWHIMEQEAEKAQH